MYAIIETGGKQVRVEEGAVYDFELLHTEKQVAFDKVLLVKKGEEVKIGAPHVAKCVVHGELVGEVKGPKVIAYKYKQRKRYRRTVGHRQNYSRVKITKIAVA